MKKICFFSFRHAFKERFLLIKIKSHLRSYIVARKFVRIHSYVVHKVLIANYAMFAVCCALGDF